ncbi:MAG TPA: PQQ-binding-like beta-propeller repeat protein [Pirellulales bacterium]|jgi:outer membrane protein assembly factor BamB|nr:PQQ-binding-like beta-propeller repeat protein [Pirellulales bacterium]
MDRSAIAAVPSPPRLAWFRTWKLPLLVCALAGGFALFVTFSGDWIPIFSDGGMCTLMYYASLGGAVVLCSAWFALLSGSAPRLRKQIGLSELAVVLAFVAVLRVEQVGGNMWPLKLVWRWSPPADAQLDPLKSATALSEQGAPGAPSADATMPGLADYPAFLGAHRHAVVTGVTLATDWKKNPPRQVWRQKIGAGWSSFAVVGTAAVTQEQRGDEELVVCYDVPTGHVRWAHADPGRFTSVLGGDGPRATPTIADGRVYTIGSTGWLNCLDLATGVPFWKTRNVLDDVGTTPDLEHAAVAWGRAGSPLLVDERVILPGGGPPASDPAQSKIVSLIAYDQRTGEKVATGGHQQISYSSPSLFTLDGQRQIVIVNESCITGHDPQTLQELWTFPWEGGSSSSATSPQTQQIAPDTLFVSKGYGGGGAVFKVNQAADGWRVTLVWHNRSNLRTKLSNCVIAGSHVFGLDEGVLECVDLATGKRLWRNGRYGLGQLLLCGHVLLVQAESGEVALVENNPNQFVELARFAALDDKTWTNPTLAGRYLLVRNAEEAACYELPVTGQ